MDKNSFLSSLSTELEKLGVEEVYINAYIGHFEKQFSKMSTENLEKQLGSYENVKNIALSIKKSIEAKKLRKAIAEKERAKIEEEQSKPDTESRNYGENSTQIRMDYIGSTYNDYHNKISKSNMSPYVFIPLALISVVLFSVLTLAVEIVLFAVLICFAILSIVFTISCVVLPVVGVYYGITLLSESTASGLFEIGLGLFALGACFGLAFLAYNVTTKLVPYCIKAIANLFKEYYRNTKIRIRIAKEGQRL